uniref:Variant surface glycoprotein 664 n=1 Tax=Trypanosoma brucei TaxID=5691 RepID=M4SYN9_9TRYP|nr:variant surface glycoprotein 664 [Trypanosoma brucei]
MQARIAELLFLLWAWTEQSHQNPPELSAITDECTEIKFLRELTEHYKSKLSAMRDKQPHLDKEANMLVLAAGKYRADINGRSYALLAAAAKEIAAEQKLKTATAAAQIEPLLNEAQKRVAQLEVQRAAKATLTTSYTEPAKNSGGTGSKAGFASPCVVTATRTFTSPQSCPNDPAAETKIKQAAAAAAAITTLPTVTYWTKAPYTDEITIKLKGNAVNTAALTSNDGCGDDNSAGTNGVAITGITTTHRKGTVDKTEVKTNNKCNAASPSDDEATKAKKTLAGALCAAQTANTETTKAISEYTTVEEITSNVEDLALLIVSGKLDGEAAAQKEKAVTSILGAKETNIKPKIFDPLSKPDPILKFTKGDAPISIESAAASGTSFARALAVYEVESHKNLAAAASTGDNPKEAERADAAEKTGEKKDGDNKTATNTTGSNSFVINKAPLLLAVFLR